MLVHPFARMESAGICANGRPHLWQVWRMQCRCKSIRSLSVIQSGRESRKLYGLGMEAFGPLIEYSWLVPEAVSHAC